MPFLLIAAFVLGFAALLVVSGVFLVVFEDSA